MQDSTSVNPKHHLVEDADDTLSLSDVNSSIEAPKDGSFWRKLLAFSGPGALVAVGYMDPGNWVTSVGGGAQYRYVLLSVVLISSLIAMMLQYMAGKYRRTEFYMFYKGLYYLHHQGSLHLTH